MTVAYCPEYRQDWADATSLTCVGCSQHIDTHIDQRLSLMAYYERCWREQRNEAFKLIVIRGEKT